MGDKFNSPYHNKYGQEAENNQHANKLKCGRCHCDLSQEEHVYEYLGKIYCEDCLIRIALRDSERDRKDVE